MRLWWVFPLISCILDKYCKLRKISLKVGINALDCNLVKIVSKPLLKSKRVYEKITKKIVNTSANDEFCFWIVSTQPAEVTRKMLRDKHNKKNPSQPIPVFPNWVYDRPALLGDFITSLVAPGEPAAAIGNLFLKYSNKCLI